jgi:hypothetical protein
LNYAFVAQNLTRIAQIFKLMSSPIAAALNIDRAEIFLQCLEPRDTIAEVGFITTLAMMYIPTYTVSTLRLLLLDPSSSFFQDPDPASRELTKTIDFSISEVPVQNRTLETPPGPTDPSSFQLSPNRFFALNTLFARAFNGAVSQSDDLLRGSLWSTDQVTASSDLLLVMYNSGHNVSMSMDNLAVSMSNYIRSTGGLFSFTSTSNSTSSMVKGTALGMETYVHVRWAWLTLPVTCVISAFFFRISVILQTRRQGALVWKSSVLAYMFHGLDRTSVEERSTGQVTEMEGAAMKVKARLAREGSWRLLRVGRRVQGFDREK